MQAWISKSLAFSYFLLLFGGNGKTVKRREVPYHQAFRALRLCYRFMRTPQRLKAEAQRSRCAFQQPLIVTA